MSPADTAITDETLESLENIDPLQQLNQLQAIIQVEQELTRLLERAQPWIQSRQRTARHTGNGISNEDDDDDDSLLYYNGARVRPIPTTMEQVEEILCLARTYAQRTSAPPGWIATAPVLNFSTPSPLPHQLRNGALAALQLQRALQQQKQQQAAERAAAQRVVESAAASTPTAAPAAPDPMDLKAPHPSSAKTQVHHPPAPALAPPLPPPPKRPRPEITMNLSDDSSSDDEE
jgi:hypothetical protein